MKNWISVLKKRKENKDISSELLRIGKQETITPEIKRKLISRIRIYRNRLAYIDKLLDKPVKEE